MISLEAHRGLAESRRSASMLRTLHDAAILRELATQAPAAMGAGAIEQASTDDRGIALTCLLVCVGASFVLRLFVADPLSERVAAAQDGCAREGRKPVAPPLLRYEVVDAMSRLLRAGRRPLGESERGAGLSSGLPVALGDSAGRAARVDSLALQLSLPSACDARHLAVAEFEGSELGTAGDRLGRSAGGWLTVLGRGCRAISDNAGG